MRTLKKRIFDTKYSPFAKGKFKKKNYSLLSEIWREEKCQYHLVFPDKGMLPVLLNLRSLRGPKQNHVLNSGTADQETRFLKRDLPETTETTSSWISVSRFAKRGK